MYLPSSKGILVLTSKLSRVPHTNMIDLAHTRNECAPEASSLTVGMKLIYGMLSYSCRFIVYTVKPPKRGHFGDGPFVPCREVVLFLEVLF